MTATQTLAVERYVRLKDFGNFCAELHNVGCTNVRTYPDRYNLVKVTYTPPPSGDPFAITVPSNAPAPHSTPGL